MTWIETDSLSFTARHDDADLACAHRVLDALEELRLRLEDRFDQVPGNVTVILHDNPAWLSAWRTPCCPRCAGPRRRRRGAIWRVGRWPERSTPSTTPGWNGARPERTRCGPCEAPPSGCTRRSCWRPTTRRCRRCGRPRRFLTYLRWAWLMEGAAQYFAGQTSFYRAAVITRLREGDRPAFPPSRRDALILGGTVFDLLDRHAGPDACVRMASRLHRQGPRGNLELAFEARMRDIEGAWRSHLDEILYRQSESLDAPSLERRPGAPGHRPRARHTARVQLRPDDAATLSQTRDRRGRRSGRQLQRTQSGPPRVALENRSRAVSPAAPRQ